MRGPGGRGGVLGLLLVGSLASTVLAQEATHETAHAREGRSARQEERAAGHEHSPRTDRGEVGRDSGAARGWGPVPFSGGRAWRVGPDAAFASIGAALAAADAWDTVRVQAGVYRERLRIRKPVVLLGAGWPAVDGGGEGHVIEATAPLELRGFVIRGSGDRVDTEDAGLMVRGAPARVEGNRFEDVFYGVYLKDAPGSRVRRNAIHGKPLPITRRGDGIRLWESPRTEILENEVVGARDVVVFFSDDLLVADNVIRWGRYGLHYMYSHHNRFLRNRFEGNQVGAFIMYSRDIELRDNAFAAAKGPGGMGLGLKDADDIRVSGNVFVENDVGVHLDNSPTGRDVRNRFEENLLLYNGTAVMLFPSVRGNVFRANDFLGNDRPAAVAGGAVEDQAAQNDWSGNHWEEYAGFDRNGDGIGDTPYAHARWTDHLASRHPQLRLFSLSPALRLVDVLARFFPLLRPRPVVVDSAPRLAPAQVTRWEETPPVATRATGDGRGGVLLAALWLLPAAGATGLALSLARLPGPAAGASR